VTEPYASIFFLGKETT